MTSVPLTPSELGRLAGPLLVGPILNWGLLGVLSMQIYIYYLAFPKDRAWHKFLVYGAFIVETTQTFLLTRSAFRTFASGFGNPAVLDEIDILWFAIPIMSGVVAFAGQAFYAYRITLLAETKYIAGLIMLLAFVQLAGAISNGVEAKNAVLFSHFGKRDAFITAGIWEGGSTACNVIIAACMTYYLARRDTGLKQTDLYLRKVIRLIIETGIFTATVAIITLILTFLPGRPIYYQASVSVLGKVYSNSMMVAFNSRMKIGSLNSTSTGRDLPIPLSQDTRRSPEITMDIDIGRSIHGVLTRDEASLPRSNGISKETDFKRNSEDFYGETTFARSTK